MLIGFIGLGKLGMPCAEAVADKGYHVSGYDILSKQSTKIDIKDSIQEVVEQSDIIFVATPVLNYTKVNQKTILKENTENN